MGDGRNRGSDRGQATPGPRGRPVASPGAGRARAGRRVAGLACLVVAPWLAIVGALVVLAGLDPEEVAIGVALLAAAAAAGGTGRRLVGGPRD